jgi:regulator of sirC expression with transglutaminase-like and TPR domain
VRFSDYAALPDESLDLVTGALLIARDEYPGLDFDQTLGELETIAEPLRQQQLARKMITTQTEALRVRLFDELGFAGNVAAYYDPRNSFLNDVLLRRLGIPITLAVLYIEVARRAGVRACGVGFPGHFLVRVGSRTKNVIVDPMSGRILDSEALEELAKRALGSGKRLLPGMLEPAPTRHVVARVLMNLRGIYAERGDYPRLLVVLDRLIDLLPDVANELRDRGFLWARLGAPRAALDDLKRYIETLPNAGDVSDVRRLIEKLELDRRSAPN